MRRSSHEFMRGEDAIEGEAVMDILVPNQNISSIYEIDLKKLQEHGVTLLLADLDNTIVSYKAPLADQKVRDWEAELRRYGIRLFVLSNSRKKDRVKDFAEDLQVPYLGRAGKPFARSFQQAMEKMGATPAQTVMVGDQIFTDAWGARNAGVPIFIVKPVHFGHPFQVLRYWIEKPFRALLRRGI